MWDSDQDIDKLGAALRAFDKPACQAFCDELIGRLYHMQETYPTNGAKRLMTMLRRKRCFSEMQCLGDAFIQCGAGSDTVNRLYAQSLLDQGHITSAILVLRELISTTEGRNATENAEAKGLLGRAYKQLYVNAQAPAVDRNRDWLDRAAAAYYEPYRGDPAAYAWHGINVVAIGYRGMRDGVPLRTAGLPNPTALAEDIVRQVQDKEAVEQTTAWDYGTAAEAAIALGRPDEALDWIRKYIDRQSRADAFEFASTLRQLEDVWGLPRATGAPNPDEEAILSLLRAAVLEREGGSVEQSASAIRSELRELKQLTPAGLERVFGTDRFQSLQWYRKGLSRCAAVARIGLEQSRGIGTGFLLAGTNLHASLGDEFYLLTNSHVISPEPEVPIAIRPEDAVVTFEGLPGAEGQTWSVKRVVYTSPIGKLDATLLALDRPVEGAEAYPIAPALPPVTGQQRLYVVGHPLGGGLSFSLQDNLLLDWDTQRVHYRTPTEPGSSGSPVFDDQWRLVALHHAGKANMPRLNGKEGTYEANEGISMQAILATISKELEAD